MSQPSTQRLSRAARAKVLSFEALIILAGVVFYFGVRGATAGSPQVAVDHAHDIVGLQERLGLDLEDEFQSLVLDSDLLYNVANWIYIWGHWPVIAVTLLWLAMRHRTVYLRLRNGMLASGGLGLLVYTTYPVAPPRLAELGLVDTVSERSQAYRVLQPPAFVNQYAAMPSLHVGWDLLVGLALVSAAGWAWLRLVGLVMPVAMALATMATANHYVLDVLAGAALALVGHAIALAVERRRNERVARGQEAVPVPAVIPAQAAVPRLAPERVAARTPFVPSARRPLGSPRRAKARDVQLFVPPAQPSGEGTAAPESPPRRTGVV